MSVFYFPSFTHLHVITNLLLFFLFGRTLGSEQRESPLTIIVETEHCNIFQNIVFMFHRKKESRAYLKQHEVELTMTEFSLMRELLLKVGLRVTLRVI